MKFPTPQRGAWTEEEASLVREHEDAIARALLCDRSRLVLRRSDGSWFIAAAQGVSEFKI